MRCLLECGFVTLYIHGLRAVSESLLLPLSEFRKQKHIHHPSSQTFIKVPRELLICHVTAERKLIDHLRSLIT
jgi:hypothetical protein